MVFNKTLKTTLISLALLSPAYASEPVKPSLSLNSVARKLEKAVAPYIAYATSNSPQRPPRPKKAPTFEEYRAILIKNREDVLKTIPGYNPNLSKDKLNELKRKWEELPEGIRADLYLIETNPLLWLASDDPVYNSVKKMIANNQLTSNNQGFLPGFNPQDNLRDEILYDLFIDGISKQGTSIAPTGIGIY